MMSRRQKAEFMQPLLADSGTKDKARETCPLLLHNHLKIDIYLACCHIRQKWMVQASGKLPFYTWAFEILSTCSYCQRLYRRRQLSL